MQNINQIFQQYVSELSKSDLKDKNEHSDRTPLENLLNAIKNVNNQDIDILHEGKRDNTGLGAPDFIVNHAQKCTVVGYIENKKIDANLNKILKTKQIEKYKKLSDNIILTDYLEWIWIYKDAEPIKARLCKSDDLYSKKFTLQESNVQEVYNIIVNFFSKEAERIKKVDILAEKLSRPALELKKFLFDRVNIQKKQEDQRDDLFAVYEIFRTGLFEELPVADFADSFAQMLTYAIFLARLNTDVILTVRNIQDYIPNSFELIKTLARFFDLLKNEPYNKEIRWAVDNIFSVINNIDVKAIEKDLSSSDEEQDPYIYFYEHFLREYDAEVRVDRGVYYTPPSIVKYLVREASFIIEHEFGLQGGFANMGVEVLDFACGTGTFLHEVYKYILAKTPRDGWSRNRMVEEHILKNIYGFEIMVSSYIISQMKLASLLKSEGYDLATKQYKSCQIYLTNTLEDKQQFEINYLARVVAQQGNKAREIKENNNIIAIMGNPPYNVSSQNNLRESNRLVAFHNDYKPKDEKAAGNINDDYIKFIAFAHKKIKNSGRGLVAIVVNNSFLKGLTHRRMRNKLMEDFDSIYVVDLHGNARIGEVIPHGILDENGEPYKSNTADQNMFDIMQGVCMLVMVKKKLRYNETKQLCQVFHIDVWGKRKAKEEKIPKIQRNDFKKLEITKFNEEFRQTKWGKKRFKDDLSFFVPMEGNTMAKYGQFWGLTDVFNVYGSGIETGNDEKFIRYENNYQDDIENYEIQKVKDITYRPFDDRKVYYDHQMLSRSAYARMQHMLNENDKNVALIFVRQVAELFFTHTFLIDKICNRRITMSAMGAGYIAPLYTYQQEEMMGVTEMVKKPNFNTQFANLLKRKYKSTTPEEVLAYIYAVLHTPKYRTEFLELLKIDFPRIPFDCSEKKLKEIAKLGQELVDAHLMKVIPQGTAGECYDITNQFDFLEVEYVRYDEHTEQIHFNKNCYFGGVSKEVWEFEIGGYQVLDKYLKARKERVLSGQEITHIGNVVKVLEFTICKMKELNEVIEFA